LATELIGLHTYQKMGLKRFTRISEWEVGFFGETYLSVLEDTVIYRLIIQKFLKEI
jgi:hypothetical protein